MLDNQAKPMSGIPSIHSYLETLESRDVPATMTPNEAFITQLYQDFLFRDPEAEGLAYHVGRLADGDSREEVALGVLNSDECLSKFVAFQYQKFLGRTASAQEIAPYVASLRDGGTFDGVRATIISSVEAFNKAGGTNEAWVNYAYQSALGRDADATGLASSLAALASGVTRFEVALGLVASEEGDKFTARHFYNDYLRRGPDATGFPGWWMALNSGISDQTVTSQFVSSTESVNNALNSRFRGVIALIW